MASIIILIHGSRGSQGKAECLFSASPVSIAVAWCRMFMQEGFCNEEGEEFHRLGAEAGILPLADAEAVKHSLRALNKLCFIRTH